MRFTRQRCQKGSVACDQRIDATGRAVPQAVLQLFLAKVPPWLRVSVLVLNLCVGSFWIFNMLLSSGAVQGLSHIHRLEPMFHGIGIFLALLYGDAAAILYAQLESSEDPYNLSASGLQPK